MNTIMYDERIELLRAIARESLGVEAFRLPGMPSPDFHIVSADSLTSALEAAYDAGLLAGHRHYGH